MIAREFTQFPVNVESVDIYKDNRNSFAMLPKSLALQIFKYLSIYDLKNCAKVSKKWRSLSFNGELWQNTELTMHELSVSSLERIIHLGVKTLTIRDTRIQRRELLTKRLFRSSSFDSLQCLDLFGLHISTDLMAELLSLTPYLKIFRLGNYDEILNIDVIQSLTALTFIEILDLNCIKLSNDFEMLNILKRARKMNELKTLILAPEGRDLESSNHLEEFLALFLELCPNLENIKLDGVFMNRGASINEGVLIQIFQMKYLQDLKLYAVKVPGLFGLRCFLKYFKALFHCKHITMHWVEMKIDLLFMLLHLCPNLKTFSLYCHHFSQVITLDVFKRIATLKHLQKLELTQVAIHNLSQICLEEPIKFTELRHMYLSCRQPLDSYFLINILLYCSQLNELTITNLEMNDKLLESISKLSKLEKLEIINIYRNALTCNPDELYLKKLQELEELSLSYPEFQLIPYEVELMLTICPNLTELRLYRISISLEILKSIFLMNQLRALYLIWVEESPSFKIMCNYYEFPGFIKLNEFCFSYSQISEDSSMIQFLLSLCGKINSLYLGCVFINEAIIECIMSLAELSDLSLQGIAGISANEIRSRLKKCHVLVDYF